MSAELAALAADPGRVADVDRDRLPELIGEAAALLARLQSANVATVPPAPAPPPRSGPDRLLTVDEAADRLGVNRRWMYRRADSLPFTRRLSSGTLRFSERGLERWQNTRR
jgi:predicted DNA-binding transcriptional regulator AlpA